MVYISVLTRACFLNVDLKFANRHVAGVCALFNIKKTKDIVLLWVSNTNEVKQRMQNGVYVAG